MTEQNRAGGMVEEAPEEAVLDPTAPVQNAAHDPATERAAYLQTPAAGDADAATTEVEGSATVQAADAMSTAAAQPEARAATNAERAETGVAANNLAHTVTFQPGAQEPEQTDLSATPVTNHTGAVVPEPVADAAADAVAEAGATPPQAAVLATETAPEAAAAVEPVADAAASAPAEQTGGASFVPVEESEEGGRPRRLKDLAPGMELEGKVTSIALYGVFVDVGVGRDGLLHISEMSESRIESPSDLVQIGDLVKVRVKSVDTDSRRISLTMRQPQTSRRAKPRPEVNRDALANLKVGDTVEGTITGLAPFGAFVDIGVGKDGLVHVSELSEARVEKPEDVVQVGQQYTFKLLEVDPDGSRISLSLRKAQRAQKMRELEAGQTFEGVINGIATFGAFVDIGVGRDGLVHISQLSEERVNKVEDVVKVGDKVTVRVLEVDPQSKRISLTMRPERQPDAEPAVQERAASEPAAPPAARVVLTPEQREEARQREQQSRRRTNQQRERGNRSSETPAPQNEVVYATEDDTDEEFEGNATLEDLISKFGSAGRRDRRRREDEDEEPDDDPRSQKQRQKQRDAIRRTLETDDE